MAHPSKLHSSDAQRRPLMSVGQLLALSFLWFPINMFWTAMLTYLLPHRVQELVGDAAKGEYLGYISLVGAIATTVIQLAVAPLSDTCRSRWGRRHPFVAWGVGVSLLCVAGFALTENFPGLLLSFLGIQFFLNVANGPYQALLPDNIHPEQEGIASAYMGIALLLGQLFGALILLSRKSLGVTGILLIITVLLAIGAVVTFIKVPDRPANDEEQMPLGKAFADLLDLKIAQNGDFFRLLLSRFFINLCYATVVAFLLYYLQDAIKLGQEGAGSFLPIVQLLATVAGLAGTFGAARALKTFTKKQIVFASSALLGAAALVFAFTTTKTLVLVLAVVFGAGWGAFQAVDWALAVNLLPKGGAAKYMAIWHVCMTVPQIIAPLFGKIADTLNQSQGNGIGWRAAMLSTVVYLCIGTYILRYVREKDAPESHPEASPALAR